MNIANAVRFGVSVVAGLLFAVLAYDVVTQGLLSANDISVVEWFSIHRNGALNIGMTGASLSGGPSSTGAYAVILIIPYLFSRRIGAAVTVGLVVYGGAFLNVALKHLLQRGRPVVDNPLMSLPTYSFPSGHAASSVVFGGLICLIAWRSGVRGIRAAIVFACALAWVMLVCLSRIYLGLHYPTDVLAGVVEALLWLIVWTAVVDRLGIDLRWPVGVSRSP